MARLICRARSRPKRAHQMSALSTSRRASIAALCTGAAATLVLFVSVPDEFPAVPPGAIILLVTAGIVAFAPGRWTLLVGLLVPLFILAGGWVTGATPDLLFSPDNAGALLGIVVQTIALLTAIASGIIGLPGEARRCAPLKPTT